MGTNYFQAEVRAIMWIYSSMFQLGVQRLLFAAFKRKLPLHGTPFLSVSYSKTALVLYSIAFPGWMICDDMIVLQCITQIFHLNAAPGPSSIFYGTENSWIKPEQLSLADAKFF